MRKLIVSNTSIVGSLQCLCSRIVMIWIVFPSWQHQFRGHDMSHEWSLAMKYVKRSKAMFVRPASTHPFNSKTRSAVQCIGTALWGVKCWAKPPYTAHLKVAKWVRQIWSLRHATNGSTTTPNTVHLLSCWACWNDLFQQTWKVIHRTRTCDLASAVRQGCQITNFTKFKILYIQETWEVLSCTNRVLWSCVSMSATSSNGILGERLKTSAHILVLWEYFAGPVKWCENVGRWEISHRAATKWACVSDQTNWFIFVKNVGQNLSKLKQHWSK